MSEKKLFSHGSAAADEGTQGWADRTRILLLSLTSSTQWNLDRLWQALEPFLKNRSWTLLEKKSGDKFRSFEEFVVHHRPHGLEQPEYGKFYHLLVSKVGEKAAALLAVSPADPNGGAPAGNSNASKDEEKQPHIECGVVSSGRRKQEQLRAITRAPEFVQHLYREDLLTQADAAKLGPAKPSPEKAATIAEVRQQLEDMAKEPPPQGEAEQRRWRRQFRKRAGQVIRDALGTPKKPTDPYAALVRDWEQADEDARNRFVSHLRHNGWIGE